METRNIRPEMHIAQQSRRERLRIQQEMNINDQNQNMELYSNNTVDQHQHQHHHHHNQHQQEINTDDAVLFQRLRFGNLSYNNPLVFTSETVNFTSQSQALLGQSSTSKDVNLVNNQESSSSTKINGDPQNFNTWKSIGSHETRDSWAVGMEGHGNNNNNNTTMIVGDLSYMNQNSYDNQHVRFSLADGSTSTMPSRIGQKHYRDVQFDSHPVTYDSGMATFARKSCHVPWTSEGVVSAYAERVEARGHTSVFSNESANAQGLALSLSSMPLTKQNQCRIDEKTASQDLIMSNNNYATLCSKPPNSMFVQKNSAAGPLGPFTGYDTILKTSKFLTPAQQLLHDICLSASPEKSNTSYVKDLHEIRPFDDDDDDGSLIEPVESNQKTQEASRNGSFRPEFLQKKEKLVHMQEEVGRRYKHYHQQMQMVYSSFESVAGLTAATPYISLALKTISRLFHSVRNAISQHLKTVRKALGEEDFSSSSNNNNNNKCDTNSSSSMFKLIDNNNNNNKQKVGVNNNLGLFEAHQQHVWRPQRGLPERAVAVLRAWLFDHFLHPYPTDSDKHMLASQTGLTRNQVSNWFINARVRIWKPMVEEIHSLESKTAAETAASNVVKNDVKTVTDASSCSNDSHQLLNPVQEIGFSGKQQQVEFPCIAGSGSGFHGNPTTMNVQTWGNHNHNRSGSVVAAGFVPYIQNGMDLGGGLGAVSLTLGLRQNVVGNIGQHSSHQQAGNQIVYDFVG